MNQLLNQLKNKPFMLIVSLPKNSVKLAEAALQGGAQGLKVHLNVRHTTSGTQFGSFEQEQHAIAEITKLAKGHNASVGIVPGGVPFATEGDFAALEKMGVDYFDAYAPDAPVWTLSQNHLGKMLAAHRGASLEFLQALQTIGMQICEASVLPREQYGKALSIADVAHYRMICNALTVPVIVPTQKIILSSEVDILRSVGVKALSIGVAVTGDTVKSVESTTREFLRHIQ